MILSVLKVKSNVIRPTIAEVIMKGFLVSLLLISGMAQIAYV
jgi:hypothetical protein